MGGALNLTPHQSKQSVARIRESLSLLGSVTLLLPGYQLPDGWPVCAGPWEKLETVQLLCEWPLTMISGLDHH